MMTWKECKRLISEDKKMFSNGQSGKTISLLVTIPLRIGTYLEIKNTLLSRCCLKIVKSIYALIGLLTGIQIPIGASIGGGLRFPHHGSIVVARSCSIGKYVTIGQNVSLGGVFFGNRKGYPEIGHHVVIHGGANISGNVKIGNYVMIGANAVVTHDVPDNSIVAGVPAIVISDNLLGKLGDTVSHYFPDMAE